MFEFAVYIAVIAFLGVTILGNIIAFRVMFAQADHVCGKRDVKPIRGYFAGYGA
ncbi:MAG: hypothetical protein ABW198_13610 [Pseudorhodoplanes sp.]|jgi:hypothetical protein